MAKVQHLGYHNDFTYASGTTGYEGMGHDAGYPTSATESDAQVKWPEAGTLSRFSVKVIANGQTTSTYRLRINGSNVNQSLSIPSSTTGYFEDTTNTDSVSDGDLVSCQRSQGTGGTLETTDFSIDFDASAGTRVIWEAASMSNVSTASTTFHFPVVGNMGTGGFSEAAMQMACPAGTWARFWVNVRTNARSTSTTVRSRVNGSNGNQSVSVPSSTTGTFEDTTNSDSITAGDLISNAVVLGTGSGNFRLHTISGRFTPSTTVYLVGGANGGANLMALDENTQKRHPFCGLMTTGLFAESNAQSYITVGIDVSHLRLYVNTNPIANSSSFISRKNGANGNLSISIPASTTGVFSDTSNSDSLALGDLYCWQSLPGSGSVGQQLKVSTVSARATLSAAPASGWGPLLGAHRNRLVRAA